MNDGAQYFISNNACDSATSQSFKGFMGALFVFLEPVG